MPPLGPEPQSAMALRVVVSDSGPLICLGRLDRLSLLPALLADVQVPDQVLRECAARPGNDDAARINAAIANGWLKPCGGTGIQPPCVNTTRVFPTCVGMNRRKPRRTPRAVRVPHVRGDEPQGPGWTGHLPAKSRA